MLPAALGNVFRAGGYQTVFGGKVHWPRPMTPESIGFEYIARDERGGLARECETFLKQKQDKPFLMVASFINPHDICYMAIDAHAKATGIPTPLAKSVVERERVAAASVLPAGVARADFFARYCPPLPANRGHTENEPGAFARLTGFRKHVREHWSAEESAHASLGLSPAGWKVDAQNCASAGLTARYGFATQHRSHLRQRSRRDVDSSHGFEHKSLPYEESARVPFIVSWPGHTPKGKVDRRHLVGSTIDLFPTLCDCAYSGAGEGLPGRGVRPIVEHWLGQQLAQGSRGGVWRLAYAA